MRIFKWSFNIRDNKLFVPRIAGKKIRIRIYLGAYTHTHTHMRCEKHETGGFAWWTNENVIPLCAQNNDGIIWRKVRNENIFQPCGKRLHTSHRLCHDAMYTNCCSFCITTLLSSCWWTNCIDFFPSFSLSLCISFAHSLLSLFVIRAGSTKLCSASASMSVRVAMLTTYECTMTLLISFCKYSWWFHWQYFPCVSCLQCFIIAFVVRQPH